MPSEGMPRPEMPTRERRARMAAWMQLASEHEEEFRSYEHSPTGAIHFTDALMALEMHYPVRFAEIVAAKMDASAVRADLKAHPGQPYQAR